jgi:hypothetical protein
MSFPALNSALLRASTGRAFERAISGRRGSPIRGESRFFSAGVQASACEAAKPGIGISRNSMSPSFRRVSPHTYPGSCSVTASGPFRRPAARRRSASADHPTTQRTRVGDPGFAPPLRGLGTSPNKFVSAAKNAAQTSSGPRQESTPWHLGAGPTRSLCEG